MTKPLKPFEALLGKLEQALEKQLVASVFIHTADQPSVRLSVTDLKPKPYQYPKMGTRVWVKLNDNTPRHIKEQLIIHIKSTYQVDHCSLFELANVLEIFSATTP